MSLLEILKSHSIHEADQIEQAKADALELYRTLARREAADEPEQSGDPSRLLEAMALLQITQDDFAEDVEALRTADALKKQQLTADDITIIRETSRAKAVVAEQHVRKSICDLVEALPFLDLQPFVGSAQLAVMGTGPELKKLEIAMINAVDGVHAVQAERDGQLLASREVPGKLSALQRRNPRVFD